MHLACPACACTTAHRKLYSKNSCDILQCAQCGLGRAECGGLLKNISPGCAETVTSIIAAASRSCAKTSRRERGDFAYLIFAEQPGCSASAQLILEKREPRRDFSVPGLYSQRCRDCIPSPPIFPRSGDSSPRHQVKMKLPRVAQAVWLEAARAF
jgi:hypothetical protein